MDNTPQYFTSVKMITASFSHFNVGHEMPNITSPVNKNKH